MALLCPSCGAGPEQRPRPIAGPTFITPSPPTERTIEVGEVVEGHLIADNLHYDVTPDVGGTLVVTLNWDHLAHQYSLELSYQGKSVSPVQVRAGERVYEIAVSAAQTYRLTVVGSGSDLFYDIPFVLTTRLR